ncbi:MAG: hypothetical protein OHK0048_04360 [Rhodoferax sp.]
MIIAGPALVIVAGFYTYYLAASRPNEIVDESTYRPSPTVAQQTELLRQESRNAPAMMGRNHATTGIVPPPKPSASP